MSNWAERIENKTLITATNHKEIWETEDLEFVAAFRDDSTNEELAIALGRSLYAIQSIKNVIDERITKEIAKRNIATRSAQKVYTFINGDVPADW